MTGKEIIDKAILQSDGKWKPSPGLIYPMLGRLLEEGLISETDSGKYRITSKGLEIVDVDSVRSIMQKQLDVMLRVGNVGKFMTMDLIDRMSTLGSTLSSNLDKMTVQERDKYKQFLLPYEDVRTADNPDQTLSQFLQSTYAAAADLGGWDRATLEDDPHRLSPNAIAQGDT